MKLSTAIREGSKHHKKASTCFMTDNKTKTCALGAAYYAKTGSLPFEGFDYLDIVDLFPASRKQIKCPIDSSLNISIVRTIAHLNDCGWARENIANWLESEGY